MEWQTTAPATTTVVHLAAIMEAQINTLKVKNARHVVVVAPVAMHRQATVPYLVHLNCYGEKSHTHYFPLFLYNQYLPYHQYFLQ